MKKKYLVISMSAILTFGIGLGAYADSTLKQVSAYLNHSLHIKLNGQDWKPSSDPITYDGSTYLPVRSAGEALGVQVGYDNDTQTVTLDSPSGSPSVSYAFTQADQHPEQMLIGAIGEATQTLDVAIYSLTLPNIVQAILDAHNRGVNVRIIADRLQSSGKSQSYALNKLAAAGIPIKINTHSGLMHLKVTIIDGKTFTTGSYNYTENASTENDEVLLVDRDPVAAKQWDDQFQRMWDDTKGFKDFASDGSATTDVSPDNETQATTTEPSSGGTTDVHYASCKDVQAAGKAPLHKGDPGYSLALDRDGDGVACEVK